MDAFFPPVTVRPLDSEAERRNGFACFRQAMLALPDLGSIEPDMETAYLAHDRMLGAFDGATLLGVTNGYDSAITVPGGAQIRHLSVTHVGVTATATRRGIARQLLTQQLRQARDTGYAVAGLRASNAGLYGRYGYGVASWSVRQELDLAQAHPAIALPRTGVRPVDPSTAFPLLRRIAAAHPPHEPQAWCAGTRGGPCRLSVHGTVAPPFTQPFLAQRTTNAAFFASMSPPMTTG
ncbi:GNAT family N-acetyltransferase [Kerstersia gyiorum]|uniref:GNAT family N-acetyltransferase n=1 Tax=Kerstersia gyiorum TaxID=206506 RepID=UPI0010714C1F|nr:GNAT family N-acetyltransferase [Kerstersia gyiorum]QBR41651.1 GNAT family N-acetyltransferase [Kerstersia gyiorum]